MNLDEIRIGLAELQAPVVPAPDPYGRLLRRSRRSRRNRWAAGLAALFTLLLAGTLSPGLVSGTPAPDVTPTGQPDGLAGEDITAWLRQLLDSPPAGSLAGDRAFLETVTAGLHPTDFDFAPTLDHRSVLYAGDVGSYRAVLVTFSSETKVLEVWLVADAGLDADRFVREAARVNAVLSATPSAQLPVRFLPQEAHPFSTTALADPDAGRYLAVGMAPAGCRIATKPDGLATQWSDAGGNTVALTGPEAPGAYARVTCGTVVRFAGPLIQSSRIELAPETVTDSMVTGAMAGMRGTPVDAQRVKELIDKTDVEGVRKDSCRALFNGTVPGSRVAELVVACASPSGGMIYQIDVPGVGPVMGRSRVRFTDPAVVLGFPVELTADGVGGPALDDRVLILAPAAATSLKVLRPGQAPQTVPLSAGVGSVLVPGKATAQVQALDAHGAVIATGTASSVLTIADDPETVVDNWN
jgi:hypothetical protein